MPGQTRYGDQAGTGGQPGRTGPAQGGHPDRGRPPGGCASSGQRCVQSPKLGTGQRRSGQLDAGPDRTGQDRYKDMLAGLLR
jgi:hypothetical protein